MISNYFKNKNRLIQDLGFFKICDKAIAPYVFLRIENTKNLLKAGIENPPLNQSMIDLCRIQNISEDSLIPTTFSQAFQLVYNKLYKHVNRHSALPLLKEIQCFNTKFIRASSSQKNILLYSYIKEFVNPEDELINEWSIYCGDNEFLEENLDLDKYWTDKQQSLPLLSRIALGYILQASVLRCRLVMTCPINICRYIQLDICLIPLIYNYAIIPIIIYITATSQTFVD